MSASIIIKIYIPKKTNFPFKWKYIYYEMTLTCADWNEYRSTYQNDRPSAGVVKHSYGVCHLITSMVVEVLVCVYRSVSLLSRCSSLIQYQPEPLSPRKASSVVNSFIQGLFIQSRQWTLTKQNCRAPGQRPPWQNWPHHPSVK